MQSAHSIQCTVQSGRSRARAQLCAAQLKQVRSSAGARVQLGPGSLLYQFKLRRQRAAKTSLSLSLLSLLSARERERDRETETEIIRWAASLWPWPSRQLEAQERHHELRSFAVFHLLGVAEFWSCRVVEKEKEKEKK